MDDVGFGFFLGFLAVVIIGLTIGITHDVVGTDRDKLAHILAHVDPEQVAAAREAVAQEKAHDINHKYIFITQ